MKKCLFLIILLLVISCERDDICPESEQTTPRLLIEFFDIADPENLKTVSGFSVYPEQLFLNTSGVLEPPTEFTASTIVFNTTATNAISLPLLIGNEEDVTVTRYVLERNTDLRLDDDTTTSSNNIDIIEITYNTEFVYVSRACGFKSIFNLVGDQIALDATTDTDFWVGSLNILQQTIENENTVHLNIFH